MEGAGRPQDRRKPGHYQRFICGVHPKGPPHYHGQVDYAIDWTWYTNRPPSLVTPEDDEVMDGIFTCLLQHRGFLTEAGIYEGPCMDRLRGGRRQQEQQAAPKTDPSGGFEGRSWCPERTQSETHWKRLREEPNSTRDMQGTYLPFTILAQEFIVDTKDWDWYGTQTKRATTRRRANISFYKRRVFLEDLETLCVCIHGIHMYSWYR